MSRIRTLRIAAGAVAFATLSTFSAQAGTVTLEASGSTPFGDPNLSRVLTIEQPERQRVQAGPFRMTNVTAGGIDLIAWCIDLAQRFSATATEYQTGTQLVSNERLNLLDRLFTQHFDNVTTRDTGAAMQVAIWEVVTEETRNAGSGALDLNLTAGAFSATGGAAIGIASGWLNDITTDATAGGFTFDFFGNPDKQDLISANRVVQPALPPSPVPLPAGIWLMLAGMGGVAALKRARKA